MVSKQNLNPPLDAPHTNTIVKNGLEMRKLRPPKVKGVKNSKKQTTKHYKGWFSNTQKFPCMSFYCYRVQRWFVELEVVLPYILNRSKWSTYDEDTNKCSIIGRQLLMGWSTLMVKSQVMLLHKLFWQILCFLWHNVFISMIIIGYDLSRFHLRLVT
jgi:hypothetical protein